MPHEDEVFPAEEQPLPAAASPTAQSPNYVPESDPEEDLEEDDDEDPKEDPVDYPTDGGDDDDEEDESSGDDEDDDVDIEADDDEEEEEHPAPADSTAVALPAVDQASSAEETSVLKVARILAISTPPSSLLSPWSSPLPQIPSLPPNLRFQDNHNHPTSPLSYPICIALGPRYKIGESSSAAAARPTGGLKADYGFVATMDREIRRDLERDRMTEFETRVRQDTDEICTRLDDEQTRRQLLAGWLNMLFRDRRAHARIARPMETEARMSGEAWGRSMDASDLVRADIMSLRTTMLAQQSEIRELQLADRRR
ncbi:hypothetical protein Tco_0888636 [Tanacetum coccineum]